jgi:hypothetical protein
MMPEEFAPIPRLADFSEPERTVAVKLLLTLCHGQRAQLVKQSDQLALQSEQLALQSEQLALQNEQIQLLRDEVAVLKGEKARPKIKPSSLNKPPPGSSGPGGARSGGDGRGKPKRKKTVDLEIHDERVIEPAEIPPGWTLKGYEPYVVQDLEISLKNTKYLRARYESPSGETVVGALPDSVKGTHYGPQLRSFILSQHYQQHVPQGLIHRQLREWGVEISAGQLNRLLIERHDEFHEEKAELLSVGLEVSSHINVDDTGARHQGKNGYCTHIGNEWFAWFSSTESKSRINFLELLQAGHTEYVIDEIAREYMRQQKLPRGPLALLSEDGRFADKTTWESYLRRIGLVGERHRRIATEGALVGALVNHGIASELVIVSDDAGQFNIAGFLNALCWVHAERTIHKLIAGNDVNREAQKAVRGEIWAFYQQLKAYQRAPDEPTRQTLEARFDEIFTQKTAYHMLNLALKRLHANKTELLLVLEHPEIPIHNNLSENDIRDYVKRRKISATTRSDAGRQARDTFLSLKKTCQKLRLSFSQYLFDRISRQNHIPPLPELVRAAAQGP